MSRINGRLLVLLLGVVEIAFLFALMDNLGFWLGFSVVSWLTVDPKALLTNFLVINFLGRGLENWLNRRDAKTFR